MEDYRVNVNMQLSLIKPNPPLKEMLTVADVVEFNCPKPITSKLN